MNFALLARDRGHRPARSAVRRREIMPVEATASNWDEHENIRLDRAGELRAKARAAGLWSPQMPKERGGQGLRGSAWRPCTRR